MNQHVLVVYRFAIATLVLAPFAIVFDRPVINQNLYYTGIKYTTVTIVTALCNVLSAFVFLLAWVCRFEKVDVKKVQCQAKILGTIGTVGGAMIMAMFNGPMLPLPWTKINNQSQSTKTDASNNEDTLKGVITILVDCVCWACYFILQAVTLKSYPAELSLTTLICFMGTIGGAVVALVMERDNAAAWAIHWDSKLLAAVYSVRKSDI
ncbi:hypothetical protein V6N13_078513 [Hibiscus sabdariffa]|uniref:WAT1-related protein n=1 Tax=Hibiscus sabdariffa TaxID=183260 RepID=A0ABR2RNT2_9ROSI